MDDNATNDILKNGEKLKNRKALFEFIQTILMAVAFYFAIDAVVDRVQVHNVSMHPTVVQGEVIFVNKLAYKLGNVERGDIITFHYPLNEDLDYIKRAIGLPGDQVKIETGKVYINGEMIDEPYVYADSGEEDTWIIPPGSYFVMGDNRQQSADSRTWGFVPEDDLIGKALAVYWPLKKIRVLKHFDIQLP